MTIGFQSRNFWNKNRFLLTELTLYNPKHIIYLSSEKQNNKQQYQ